MHNSHFNHSFKSLEELDDLKENPPHTLKGLYFVFNLAQIFFRFTNKFSLWSF